MRHDPPIAHGHPAQPPEAHAIARVPFREALRFWWKLGFVSFGGPSGQIALLHDEVVDRRRWVPEPRFLHAMSYCMLLPGPEAQQLATYVGWLLHGTRGGLAAGLLFVLPSVAILLALSWAHVALGHLPAIAGVFYGLKPAVIAIVASAVVRMWRRAITTRGRVALALVACVALHLGLPFPWLILLAAASGCLVHVLRPIDFDAPIANDPPPSPSREVIRAHLGRAVRVLGVGLFVWWAPVLLAAFWLGRDHTLVDEGVFFSKAALVTFGGAYAVLPYVAQHAVERFAWLTPTQMLDGLGLAETTPGPLIMVVQFVGFLGGWNHPGELPRGVAATLGALLSTWVTFAPCFLWIFLGAPYVERMRQVRLLTDMLDAVAAVVVGVLLRLGLWFAAHTLWRSPGGFDVWAAGIAGLALVALLWRRWGPVPVIGSAALVGVAVRLVVGPY
jgi:chromate transporter